jgi:hypothetical protein
LTIYSRASEHGTGFAPKGSGVNSRAPSAGEHIRAGCLNKVEQRIAIALLYALAGLPGARPIGTPTKIRNQHLQLGLITPE